MKSSKKNLMKNTFMLYLVRFSTYFFSFISIPYQTRVVGSAIYGKLAVAMALTTYFQLFLDFGFILSATAAVSKNRDDKEYLKKRYTSVSLIKCVFSIISVIVMFFICSLVPQYKQDMGIYFLYLLAAIVNSFLPDFLYRGLEEMTPITFRTVVSKATFTILLITLLKRPQDYYLVPLITCLGNLVALVWSIVDVHKRFDIRATRISLSEIISDLRSSASFFLSRIASTLYTVTNTIILGFIDPGGVSVGYYSAADKLINTGSSALAPISDSIYPYMIAHKDLKLVNKILKIMMPIIIIGCTGVWIFADEFCQLVFGNDFIESANILRAMLPLAVSVLPDYLYGFPTLGSIGLAKHANYSIYFSTTIHLVLLAILFFTGNLTAFTLACLVSIGGISDLLYRGTVVFLNRNRFSK